MGNLGATFKRFFANKNTVTIIGVFLGIIVLYIGYNWRVNNAIEEVNVPYAKKTLTATTEITADAIGTTKVLKSFVSSNSNLMQSIQASGTTRLCVQVGTSVPQGAFFYTEQVVECNSISSNVFDNMPDGYRPVSLPVNLQSTYGNSMYPGDYIDIYVRTNYDGKLVYGEFITKLPILDVRDNSGKSIFYGATTSGSPSILLFAVPNYDEDKTTNLYLLLSKATMLNTIELVPVPGNASYTQEVGETKVTSQWLKQLIINQTASIPDEAVTQ